MFGEPCQVSLSGVFHALLPSGQMNILLGAQKVFIFPMIPGMMSVLQVLRRLIISNCKLVVMSNWIISEEQFGRHKSMNPHLPCILRMHHLI